MLGIVSSHEETCQNCVAVSLTKPHENGKQPNRVGLADPGCGSTYAYPPRRNITLMPKSAQICVDFHPVALLKYSKSRRVRYATVGRAPFRLLAASHPGSHVRSRRPVHDSRHGYR